MAPGSSRSAGSEAARRPAAVGATVPFVGGGRLPLAFIVAGLVSYGFAAPWLAWTTWAAFPVLVHPELVAVSHLWLPGFLLSVCFGATYQLMPVVLGRPLRIRESWLWSHASLHVAGVGFLVWGLARGHYLAAGLGGLAVVAGVGVLVAATLRTFLESTRRDATAWSFVFAALWLLVTVAAGVLMALNRKHGFLPLAALDVLRAHAHLGLVGYFGTLLQGVTFQLLPMFTMGEARRPRVAMAGLLATQAGLPALAVGLAWGLPRLTALGVAVLVLGCLATGIAVVATLATRRRRRLDPGLRAFLIGLGLLALSGAGGLGLTVWPLAPERLFAWASSYGLLVIVGGLSLSVLGMLAKILPFLVWMRAYGPRVGKQPVPVATSLSSHSLEHWWLGTHLAGLCGLCVAAGTGLAWLGAAGGALLVAGAAIWSCNALRVLLHLRPRSPGSGPRPREARATVAAASSIS